MINIRYGTMKIIEHFYSRDTIREAKNHTDGPFCPPNYTQLAQYERGQLQLEPGLI